MSVKVRLPTRDVRPSRTRRVFGRFRHYLRPHTRPIASGSVALLALALVEIVKPWPLKIVFDYVFLPTASGGDFPALRPLQQWDPINVVALSSGLLVLFAVLGALLSQAHVLAFARVGQKIAGSIRLDLFSHVQTLPQSYHDYRETGELMMRLTGDINLLRELLVSIFVTMGSRFVIVLGMLGVMFYLNWQLTLIALAAIPMLLLTTVRFSSRMRKASRRQRQKEGKLAASVYEGVDGVLASKLFGQEKYRRGVLRGLISSSTRAGLRAKRLQATYERWVDIITAVVISLVLFFGVQQVMAGEITAGSLLVFIAYLRTAYKPIRQISRLSGKVSKATVSGERVLEILDMEPDVRDDPDGISARHVRGNIAFQGVSHAYVSGQKALRKASFDVPGGKTTAIIGRSGAGKSTVARLIARLYEPDKGRISIDDAPIDRYRLRSLRKQVTFLSQDAALSRQSIRENIAFGKPDAEMNEIVAAAESVGAHGFIQELPDGYETLVGEGGQTLSGGQRQRIAFARAALRNSRIMLFDEPATGLDAAAEGIVREALAALARNRTILLLTHRLNMLDLVEWIVFLEDGVAVEQGTMQSLLERRGRFYEFHARWAKGTETPEPQASAL